jgi:flagellar biosynthesis protein FliR
MATTDLQSVLNALWQLETQLIGPKLDVILLLFTRLIAFVSAAPILGRKDIPFEFKLTLSIILTLFLAQNLRPDVMGSVNSQQIGTYTLLVALNAIAGLLLGFFNQLVFETIASAGNLITNQIGMQQAMMMDPSTRQQSAVLAPLFSFLVTVLYMDMGGIQFLLEGLSRSFTLIPVTHVQQNWIQGMSYAAAVEMSGNVLKIALLISAPFFVLTILLDVILGIVNRSAQQIPVFQLSNSIKPLLGLIVFYLFTSQLIQTMGFLLKDSQRYFQ